MDRAFESRDRIKPDSMIAHNGIDVRFYDPDLPVVQGFTNLRYTGKNQSLPDPKYQLVVSP